MPTDVAKRLRSRLESVRGTQTASPDIAPPGPWEATEALFLPAAARRRCSAAFLGASARVEIKYPPPELVAPALLAVDAGHRQRRRKTWEQNLARYAQVGDVKIHFEIECGEALREILGAEREPKRASGGRG